MHLVFAQKAKRQIGTEVHVSLMISTECNSNRCKGKTVKTLLEYLRGKYEVLQQCTVLCRKLGLYSKLIGGSLLEMCVLFLGVKSRL